MVSSSAHMTQSSKRPAHSCGKFGATTGTQRQTDAPALANTTTVTDAVGRMPALEDKLERKREVTAGTQLPRCRHGPSAPTARLKRRLLWAGLSRRVDLACEPVKRLKGSRPADEPD